jgi:hypothetical protein
MKIKFITCIYDNLFGTDLGGRFNRGGHYRHSLKAIMNITVADFLLYTSEEEIEDLRNFFYAECGFTEDRLQIKTYDIRNTPYKEKFELYKNLEEVKQSDRCPEIQYAKLTWLEDFNEPDYDYLFWIDAGLSSNILFPDRYFPEDKGYYPRYFGSSAYTDTLVQNLVKYVGDKVLLIRKDNTNNFWSGTVPGKYYTEHRSEKHIIGGLFGGQIESTKEFARLFRESANTVLDGEKKIFYEENIMSLVYYNNQDLFATLDFDIWWHEDERINYPDFDIIEHTTINKSFYKIFVELENMYA